MTTRKYSSRSQQTTLTAALTSTATTATVGSGSTLLGGITISAGETYTVVIDPDTALEEIVDVTAVSTNTLTIVRGIETGGVGQAHSAGAVVRHMVTGRDLREANQHIENTTTAHGLTIANVVSTTDTSKVSSGMIVDGAIGTAKIDDTAVTAAKLAPNSVTTAKIVDANVTTAKVADGAITSAKIADSAITSAKIADGTIATGDIADGAITSAKILDGTIATADLADGAVTSAKIADGTIVNADVNTSAQIAYGKLSLTNSVTNADINASAAIALSKLATDPLARANHTGTQTASTISDFDTQVRTSKVTDLAAPTSAFSMNSQKITNVLDPTSAQDVATKAYADTKIASTEKGAANGVATLGSDGKLTTSQIPDVTITDTFVVSSQAAMLALTAQVGDVAVRTDLNKSFILKTAGASTLANWQELLTPTDAVTSVDGQTGTVNLSGVYDPLGAAASKLPLAGGTMSGNIAMGTNKITGLGDPTNAQDAATKNYIDTVVLAPSNLTGPITSVGNVTSIASQTGTGTKFVVDQSPTIVTPTLSGNTTAGTINNTTIPSSKTLVATDSTAYVVPSQTGNAGKALTTDGTTSSWSNTINGTAIPASKTLVDTDSSQTLTNKTLTAPVVTLATNAQAGAYTLVLTDAGKLVELSGGGTLTVPTNASVAFPIGTQIHILQTGASQVTVGGAGVTINATPGLKLRAQWSGATLIKRATDTWVLVGDLSA